MKTRSITLWKIFSIAAVISLVIALQQLDQHYANKVGEIDNRVEHFEFLN